jgi:hypothetical protein
MHKILLQDVRGHAGQEAALAAHHNFSPVPAASQVTKPDDLRLADKSVAELSLRTTGCRNAVAPSSHSTPIAKL